MIPPKEFLKKIKPFSLLPENDLATLLSGLEVALFPKDTTIYRKGSTKGGVYLVFSGLIGLYDEEHLVDYVSRGELFGIVSSIDDSPALFDARCQEDSVCYVISNDNFRKIYGNNPQFASFFNTFINKRFRSFSKLARQQRDLPDAGNFLVPIASLITKSPITCPAGATIVEATQTMHQSKVGSIVVVDELMAPLGMFTSKDLRKVILRGAKEDPVTRFMSAPVVTIQDDKALFDAYTTMINHAGIDHLVVVHTNRVKGVLTSKDILSHFEPSSSILAIYRKIVKAAQVEELKTAFAQTKTAVARMAQRGIHFYDLSRMITSVNDTVVKKVIEIVLNEQALKDFVWVQMGSSGRREQILTTDQDNALVHLGGEPGAFAERVNELLADIGIAKCPANYMASNPLWQVSLDGWKEYFHSWFAEPVPDHLRYLTVFLDMRPLYGDVEIYDELLSHMYSVSTNQAVRMLAHDATMIEPPIGIFGIKHLDKGLDLKKFAIYPIVNGIRVMALENRILEITNTRSRIETLQRMGALGVELAEGLIESYEFIQDMRLRHHARLLDSPEPVHNKLQAKDVHKMDLLVLKEAFKIVASFQKFLKSRYAVEGML